MILKSLCDYYDLKKEDLPIYGTKLVEISFVIVIDKDGNFVRFEDLRDEKKKKGSDFQVRRPEVRTAGVKANFLYDNGTYVLGIVDSSKDSKKNSGNIEKLLAFVEKIRNSLKKQSESASLKSLCLFYKKYIDDSTPDNVSINKEVLLSLQKDPIWNDVMLNISKNFSFRIDGDIDIVAEKKGLIDVEISENDANQQANDICLITGNRCDPVELTAATMIPGSQAVAKIVSFQVSQGYDSYGKSKCRNAPISPEAEFKYSTALLDMLGRDSKHKFLLSSRTFLFWASCTDKEMSNTLDNSLLSLFGSREASPDDGIEKVVKVFKSIYTGVLRSKSDDRFYILALAPNSARIAVTYWAEIPLNEFVYHILRHIDDMDIIDTRQEKKAYFGLYNILSACISEEKVSDCKSKMPELIAKSIFSGTQYPINMLQGCINRIRASKTLTITRAGIIKAYLNRKKDNQQKITKMLNKENTNPGYLCGRLFAVLDKIQYAANGIHSIRERYMNSASATPAAIFPTILKLSNHHREKLSDGMRIYYEKVIQEISEKMGDSIPTLLNLEDQGRFFLGFYQQNQDFYTSKENNE